MRTIKWNLSFKKSQFRNKAEQINKSKPQINKNRKNSLCWINKSKNNWAKGPQSLHKVNWLTFINHNKLQMAKSLSMKFINSASWKGKNNKIPKKWIGLLKNCSKISTISNLSEKKVNWNWRNIHLNLRIIQLRNFPKFKMQNLSIGRKNHQKSKTVNSNKRLSDKEAKKNIWIFKKVNYKKSTSLFLTDLLSFFVCFIFSRSKTNFAYFKGCTVTEHKSLVFFIKKYFLHFSSSDAIFLDPNGLIFHWDKD